MAKKTLNPDEVFAELAENIRQKKYSPVYLLDGEEPYYTDALSDFIAANVLEEHEKEFNQTIIYAQDSSPEELASVMKRYPMMAEYQVVIVREVQNWHNKLDRLAKVLEKPVATTILVLCYRGKKVDGRSKVTKLVRENGVYFTSEKVPDYKMQAWLTRHCRRNKIAIEPAAAAILTEHIGDNIGNMVQALNKLKLMLPEGATITPDAVSEHIGINKDYNIFELQKALSTGDTYKALFIADYFAKNQKDHHIVAIILGMYGYFIKLVVYAGMKHTGNKNQIASAMGINPFFLREYQQAAQRYQGSRLFESIDVLYDIELKAKGVTQTGSDSGDLVRELVSRLVRI